MAKKSGLGKGLSNLIPSGGRASSGSGGVQIVDHPDYRELSIKEIVPNPDQPRKRINEAELNELAKTLHSVGLIEPIVVRKLKNEDRYQIISGERRFLACKKAGFKKIPAVLKQVNDIQALEMGIIENIQREELNPIEEGRAYQSLMDQTGQKPAQIAEKVGKDRSTITNLMRLLKLPDQVLELIETGNLSAGQARPLLSLGDQRMLLKLAGRIAREGWSARRVEDEIARIQEGPAKSSGAKKEKKDANIKHLEERLRAKFTTKVDIAHARGGKGKITLHYNNLDDLDRLLEAMKVRL